MLYVLSIENDHTPTYKFRAEKKSNLGIAFTLTLSNHRSSIKTNFYYYLSGFQVLTINDYNQRKKNTFMIINENKLLF